MEPVIAQLRNLHPRKPLIILHTLVMVSITKLCVLIFFDNTKSAGVADVGDDALLLGATFNMEGRIEKRSGVKMCVLLGLNPAQTIQKMQDAYGDKSLSPTAIKMWHKRFREDPEASCKDQPHTGLPRTKRIQKADEIIALVEEEGQLTTRQLGSQVGVSHTTVKKILKDKDYVKLAPKFVP